MIAHLDSARLELQRALEGYGGACQLDPVTQLILEAVRAIDAVRRELLSNLLDKPKRDRGTPGRHLEGRAMTAPLLAERGYFEGFKKVRTRIAVTKGFPWAGNAIRRAIGRYQARLRRYLLRAGVSQGPLESVPRPLVKLPHALAHFLGRQPALNTATTPREQEQQRPALHVSLPAAPRTFPPLRAVVKEYPTAADALAAVVAGLESDIVRAALRARHWPEQFNEGAA